MINTFQRVGAGLVGAAFVLSAACTQDLNVTNPNNPDVARAIANPSDVEALATSSVQAWYTGSTSADPWIMLNVTGDLEIKICEAIRLR